MKGLSGRIPEEDPGTSALHSSPSQVPEQEEESDLQPSPLGLAGSCGDAAALVTGLEAAQVDGGLGRAWLGEGSQARAGKGQPVPFSQYSFTGAQP